MKYAKYSLVNKQMNLILCVKYKL